MNPRQTIKKVVLVFLNFIAAIAGRRMQPAILMYHDFDTTNWKHGVDPAELERQIEYLVKYRKVVPLPDVVAWSRREKEIPTNAVAITIDDGYADTYEVFFSLAKKHKLPFTLFLTTDLSVVDKLGSLPRPTWEQLKAMVDSGIATIGVHGHTHTNFPEALKAGNLESELITCHDLIQTNTGVVPKYVAYPAGRHNANVVRHVKELGYEAACSASPGVVGKGDNHFLLRRIGVDRQTSSSLFKARLGRGYPLYVNGVRAVRRFKRKLQKVGRVLGKLVHGKNPLAVSLPQSHWDGQFASGYWSFLLDAPVNVQHIVKEISTKYADKNPRILDVGCGNGVIPKLLKETGMKFEYVGTDISAAALEQAREHLSEGTFACASMEDTLDFDDKFDVVIFSEVLLYGNARKTLQANSESFKPEADIIISLYRNWRSWLIWWQIKSLFKEQKVEELQDKEWGSGWRVAVGTMRN